MAHDKQPLRQYLEGCAPSPKAAGLFRNPGRIVGTTFDPELAYLPANVVGHDGEDGCRSCPGNTQRGKGEGRAAVSVAPRHLNKQQP